MDKFFNVVSRIPGDHSLNANSSSPTPFLHLGRHLVMSGDVLVVSAGWRMGVGELLLAFNELSPGMLLKL